jgi:uncharacterized membrane protein
MKPLLPTQHHHYYSFRAPELLPFLDGVFAVAFTLVALTIPDRISTSSNSLHQLLVILSSSALSSLAVLLYWFKLRRLVVSARLLYLRQLVLLFISLLVLVILPQMASLALRYGQGEGTLFHWTESQAANVFFLGVLFVFDLLVLAFAFSLRHHRLEAVRSSRVVRTSLRAHALGFCALLLLALMELIFLWFNYQ